MRSLKSEAGSEFAHSLYLAAFFLSALPPLAGSAGLRVELHIGCQFKFDA